MKTKSKVVTDVPISPNEALYNAINRKIYHLDTGNDLTIHQIAWMTKRLENFIHHATCKFIRGQREHGGDLLQRDTLKDLTEEHIDSFWYLSAEQTKRKN